MIFLPNSLFRMLLIGFVLAPSAAHAQVMRYRFDLDTTPGFCSAATAETSCVRYNGDSAFYPGGTSFLIDADFGAQVGNVVPVDFQLDFYFPDVVLALNQTIVIDAPGEVVGLPPTGTWNVATGAFDIDMGPVDFPNALPPQTLSIDPFDAVAAPISGSLQCLNVIPPMNGSPLSGGEMTMVGRGCLPILNEAFFVVLKGTLTTLPEPGSPLLAGAALLALLVLANRPFHRKRMSP